MKRFCFITAVAVSIVNILTGCYYDNEALLYPAGECVSDTATYGATVSRIIGNNCLACHSQSAANGGIVLEGYSNLKTHVDNGKLVGAISHTSGFQPMPKNAAQLSACDIEKIKAWIASGATNN